MRILYVANVSDLYGASRSLLRLVRRAVEDGHQAEVILPEDGPLCAPLEQAGARVFIHRDLPILRGRNLSGPRGCARLARQTLTSTVRLVKHLRRTRPDLVHTNSGVVLSPGLAARICRVPHVWHMREFMQGASRMWIAYQWLMATLASVIVCNSAAVASQFHPIIRRRKVRVIYNGIPSAEMKPASREQAAAFRRQHGLTGNPLIGVVGRIHLEQKGQDVFAQAAASLAGRRPEAGFVVAGSPYPGNQAHFDRLKAQIEESNLNGRLICTGQVDDLAALYSALDICVLPAKKPEGLGNVLLEAMALGKPVVGTATGGIPEIIEDGHNGYLVEPGDAPALAAALDKLIGDAGLRRRMGEAGRARFEERFGFAACYASLAALYHALADRHPVDSVRVLGMRVDATSYEAAAERVVGWAREGASRYVCCASVNNVMEAHDSRAFRRIMNAADLVTPDGMPLVWGLRLLGARGAGRVYGPDLMRTLLARAEAEGIAVGLYGGTPRALEQLLAALRRRHPALNIAYSWSPPFRLLSEEEDETVMRRLCDSGARLIFVGLSTPKQERWMAAHRGRFPAVMLGVGAAFDFLAGIKPQAPPWMQRSGLEWSFRLATEPRRLWRRYLKQNPRFAALFALELLEKRLAG